MKAKNKKTGEVRDFEPLGNMFRIWEDKEHWSKWTFNDFHSEWEVISEPTQKTSKNCVDKHETTQILDTPMNNIDKDSEEPSEFYLLRDYLLSCQGATQEVWYQKGIEMLSQLEHEAKQEEHQFFLNILDGIDIADEQMGNKSGGTLAIRLALKSRII